MGGHLWSPKDKEALLRLLNTNAPREEYPKILKRTDHSIRSKLHYLQEEDPETWGELSLPAKERPQLQIDLEALEKWEEI